MIPRPRPPARRSARDPEAGSAYLVTLLVLLVLSILGLSLSVIGQTELQIGSNEMTSNRVFYAADAGVGMSVARVMYRPPDFSSFTFRMEDEAVAESPIVLGSVVDVSPIVPISHEPCHLCQINEGAEFFQVNHILAAAATRRGWRKGSDPTPSDRPLGRETVSASVQIQPWQQASPGSVNFTEEELQKVKL